MIILPNRNFYVFLRSLSTVNIVWHKCVQFVNKIFRIYELKKSSLDIARYLYVISS